jgi:hypothetical protein
MNLYQSPTMRLFLVGRSRSGGRCSCFWALLFFLVEFYDFLCCLLRDSVLYQLPVKLFGFRGCVLLYFVEEVQWCLPSGCGFAYLYQFGSDCFGDELGYASIAQIASALNQRLNIIIQTRRNIHRIITPNRHPFVPCCSGRFLFILFPSFILSFQSFITVIPSKYRRMSQHVKPNNPSKQNNIQSTSNNPKRNHETPQTKSRRQNSMDTTKQQHHNQKRQNNRRRLALPHLPISSLIYG